MSTLKTGDQAPSFCLPDEKGDNLSLSDLKGKWIILYFYPRDNTPGCTTEASDFSAGLDDFAAMNAVVIGISRDSEESHRRFIEKKGLKVTLLSDKDHKTMEDYGVWQLKKMYGRESMGIVRTTYLIDPGGKIVSIWPKVKVKGHAGQVKDFLEKVSSS